MEIVNKSIIQIINNYDSATAPATEAAIMAAFWYGQCVGAKRLGLKYQQKIKIARDKSTTLRYHKQAKLILATIDNGNGYIYDVSFNDDEIKDWDFNLPKEVNNGQ